MECKTVPKLADTYVDLVKRPDNPSTTSCSRYGFKCCFGILFAVLLVYCIYLHYCNIKNEDQIRQMRKILESYGKHPTSVKKVHMERYHHRQQRRQRTRRHTLEQLYQKITSLERTVSDNFTLLEGHVIDLSRKPMVHLRGPERLETIGSGYGCSSSQKCFLWEWPNDSSFEYVPSGDNALGIKITRAGQYLVYSQIGFNGLSGDLTTIEPSFSYEIIKWTSQKNEPTVLSKAYITQDDRGVGYDTSSGDVLKPVDTKPQMGLYRLNCNDIIMIRYGEQLRSVRFSQDPVRSYFGVILQAHRKVGDYGCY